jgi:hypothetical protein
LLVCVGAKKPGCRRGYLDVCRVTLDKTINNVIKIQKDEIQMVCSYIRKKKEKTGRNNQKQWINGKMQVILVEMDELME